MRICLIQGGNLLPIQVSYYHFVTDAKMESSPSVVKTFSNPFITPLIFALYTWWLGLRCHELVSINFSFTDILIILKCLLVKKATSKCKYTHKHRYARNKLTMISSSPSATCPFLCLSTASWFLIQVYFVIFVGIPLPCILHFSHTGCPTTTCPPVELSTIVEKVPTLHT